MVLAVVLQILALVGGVLAVALLADVRWALLLASGEAMLVGVVLEVGHRPTPVEGG